MTNKLPERPKNATPNEQPATFDLVFGVYHLSRSSCYGRHHSAVQLNRLKTNRRDNKLLKPDVQEAAS